MSTASRIGSVFRSSPFKGAASRIFIEVKPCRSSTLPVAVGRSPLRLFRCPVEMSCCVELVPQFRSTTSIDWARSPVSVSARSCGWIFEGS